MSSTSTLTCPHYWLIDDVRGPLSKARCRLCGQTKTFENSVRESDAEIRFDVSRRAKARHERERKARTSKPVDPHVRSRELAPLRVLAEQLLREGWAWSRISNDPRFDGVAAGTLYGWLRSPREA